MFLLIKFCAVCAHTQSRKTSPIPNYSTTSEECSGTLRNRMCVLQGRKSRRGQHVKLRTPHSCPPLLRIQPYYLQVTPINLTAASYNQAATPEETSPLCWWWCCLPGFRPFPEHMDAQNQSHLLTVPPFLVLFLKLLVVPISGHKVVQWFLTWEIKHKSRTFVSI